NLEKITIQAATGNAKSRAIPERLGFQLEGILRRNEFLYDHFVDHAVYSMLKEEWQERARPKR
ncbi:N-acetyltransferase, partial [Mesorhizobium sp. M00.F.Ca.ET.186.01.1.1]